MLQEALESRHSTLFFGNVGRHPSMLEFLLSPHLVFRGEDNWFEYKGRDLYLWVEPEFDTFLDDRYKHLVFTSHLNLKFNPRTTRVRQYHLPVRPANDTPIRVTVNTDNAHEAFLGVLSWSETYRNVTFFIYPALKQRIRDALFGTAQQFRKYINDRALERVYLLQQLLG